MDIIHRDIRPANLIIMLDDGEPVLTASVVTLVVLTAAGRGGIIWGANHDLHWALDRERRGAYFQRIALAEREWAADNPSRMEELLGQCPEDLRGCEWPYPPPAAARPAAPALGHDATVLEVAVSPDGRR